jgi:hypothetical protein
MARTQVLTILVSGAVLLTTAALPAQSERKLEISFQDGAVTLVASNVTVREILNEWARKGGTRILNGERIQGGPVTLQFDGLPERMVMDSLLRSAAGYVLGPRVAGQAGSSQFGIISILPTTTSVAGPSYGAPAPAPMRPNPDNELPPVTPPIGTVDPNRPVNAPPGSTQQQNPNNPGQSDQGYKPAVSPTGVVPIVPITPTNPTAPPPAGGRGRGGGGA